MLNSTETALAMVVHSETVQYFVNFVQPNELLTDLQSGHCELYKAMHLDILTLSAENSSQSERVINYEMSKLPHVAMYVKIALPLVSFCL